MEEMKHVVMNNELQYRDDSKSLAPFRTFPQLGFGCKEQNRKVFKPKVFNKLEAFDSDLDRRNQANSYGED